jgi:hypothetical protein
MVKRVTSVLTAPQHEPLFSLTLIGDKEATLQTLVYRSLDTVQEMGREPSPSLLPFTPAPP